MVLHNVDRWSNRADVEKTLIHFFGSRMPSFDVCGPQISFFACLVSDDLSRYLLYPLLSYSETVTVARNIHEYVVKTL